MNKTEFLKQLKSDLSGMPVEEIDEILRDQSEYITDAVRSGRQEEEVIRSLGPSMVLAKELKANRQIKSASDETKLFSKTDKVFKAILAICVLAPLNLIFVLGPFLVVCSILFSFWTVSGSGVLAGVVAAGISFFTLPAGFFVFLTVLFGSLGFVGISVLSLVGCYYLTIWILKGTLSYLKWNIRFVSGEDR